MAGVKIDLKALPTEVRKKHKAATLAYGHGKALIVVQDDKGWTLWQLFKKGWRKIDRPLLVVPKSPPKALPAPLPLTKRDLL